jgi:tetratricopeptide (TPR) repeat protein
MFAPGLRRIATAALGPTVRAGLSLVSRGLVGAAWVVLLAACAKQSPEALVRSAEQHLARHEDRVALIELKNAVELSPSSGKAYRLLGTAQLRSGAPSAAEDAFRRALALSEPTDDILPSLAVAMIGQGRHEKLLDEFGTRRLERPSAEAAFETDLGRAWLLRGDVARAGDAFRSALAAVPAYPPARLGQARIVALSGRVDEAFATVDEVLAANPKLVEGQLLKAQLLLSKGTAQLNAKDLPGARQSLEAALKLRPDYVPVARALAEVAIAEKRPEEAKHRYEEMLARKPNDEDLLIALAELEERTGDQTAAVAALHRAIKANAASPAAYGALVRLQLRNHDPEAAIATARDAAAANPRESQLLELLGDTQQATGALDDAARTYKTLALLEPKSVRPLLKRAAVLADRKEFGEAANALRLALRIVPDQDGIAQRLVAVDLAAGNFDDALGVAKAVQARKPAAAIGQTLEGDVYVARKEWRQAERAYRAALAAEPGSTEVAARLVWTLSASGHSTEAATLVRDWLARTPNDVAMRMIAAESALGSGAYKVAASHYELVLNLQPDNFVALNNLAWILGELKDPRAVALGERAVAVAPGNPAALDTLGVVLLAQGDPTKAVEYLTQAQSLAPGRQDIRLHYAKGLLRVGRTEEAKQELRQLASSRTDFPGKSEVAGLLGQR